MGMELRRFSYVIAVAETRSFTKAAARLYISQPALSTYISKLEEELEVKLFDRTSTPLSLTYAGEQYLKRARLIMEQMEDMDREIRDITQNLTGKLRLGFPSERIIYMLPLMMEPFKKKYPKVEIDVVTGAGSELIRKLRMGKIDFVFLPRWVCEKDISQEKICREELVLTAAPGYLKKEDFLDQKHRIISWRNAARYPLITLKKGHALRESVDVLYKNSGVQPDIILESHSNMLSCRLSARGQGIAIVPEITLGLMDSDVQPEYYHLSEIPVTWDVHVLYRQGMYVGKIERDFIEIAIESLNHHKKKL